MIPRMMLVKMPNTPATFPNISHVGTIIGSITIMLERTHIQELIIVFGMQGLPFSGILNHRKHRRRSGDDRPAV